MAAALSQLHRQARALRDLAAGSPTEVTVSDQASDLQWVLLDLEDAIESAASQVYAKAARKDQRLVVRVNAEIAQVWADEGRLKMMLTQLIAAAIKHAPAHSSIRIQASREGDECIISLFREDASDQEGHATLGRGGSTVEMLRTLEAAKKLALEHGGRLMVDGGPVPGAMVCLALPLVT